MKEGTIELTFDDVIRTADEFSEALLMIWACQRETEALTKSDVASNRMAWTADAEAKLHVIAEYSKRAWETVREKGRILYHVAIQSGAGEEFLMRLGAGLQVTLLTENLYMTLEATAKSIKADAFVRKEHPPARRKLTKDEANVKARDYLKEHPTATIRDLAAGIGCSSGLISKLSAWRAVKEQRDKGRKPKKASVVRMTRKLEMSLGAEDESLAKLIAEQSADAEPSPLEDDPKTERLGAPRKAKVYLKG